MKYTREQTEVIAYLVRHSGLGLPKAIEEVKAMSAQELREKRERIAEHTHH